MITYKQNLQDSIISQSNKSIYFPELDGLRFFSFMLVFFHHNYVFRKKLFLNALYTHGWIGVDLFFALSAFLFTKLLIAEIDKTKTIDFRKFYIRRIFRIWPIYFLYTGLCVAIYLFVFGLPDNVFLFRIIGLFTFTDNIVLAIHGWTPVFLMLHLWTISYEEQFYIFVPVIIFFLVRCSIRVRVFIFIFTILALNLFRLFFISKNIPHPAIWVLPITHFESILLGIVVGFGGLEILKKVPSILLAFLGIAFFVCNTYLPNVTDVSYQLFLTYILAGLSTCLILFAVLHSHFLKSIFSFKLFVFLGKRSYGLYLYHILGNMVSLYLIKQFASLPGGLIASAVYSLSFTILVALLSYRYIETPFLKWKKKYEVITSRPI
jgi:peptidoglycan/LPS O-acetylase OafA/YrhL